MKAKAMFVLFVLFTLGAVSNLMTHDAQSGVEFGGMLAGSMVFPLITGYYWYLWR